MSTRNAPNTILLSAISNTNAFIQSKKKQVELGRFQLDLDLLFELDEPDVSYNRGHGERRLFKRFCRRWPKTADSHVRVMGKMLPAQAREIGKVDVGQAHTFYQAYTDA